MADARGGAGDRVRPGADIDECELLDETSDLDDPRSRPLDGEARRDKCAFSAAING